MRIILVGKAASGKDYFRNKLESRGFKKEVSFTTRPPRSNEVDGVDYHFIKPEKYMYLREINAFKTDLCFNGWHYATSKDEWNNKGLFIFAPTAIKLLSPEDRKNSFIIYLDIPYELRKERLMARSDADKVERRLAADEYDFKDFTDYDVRITNSDF